MSDLVAWTRIVKTDYDEYRVLAYTSEGKRMKQADYFTPDLDDARETAKAMTHAFRTGRTAGDR